MPSRLNARNWNISGAFSLGANLLVAAMPYLPHLSIYHRTASTLMPPTAAALQTTGATMCIIATAMISLRGNRAFTLRTSKGFIAFANVLFGIVGWITDNPFMIAMAFLGLVASLIPQLKQSQWPVELKGLDTPPKAAAALDFPNIVTQIGSALTKDPYWFGVAAFCIARMLYQYFAPPVDRLN